jgi:hypothetical protein
MNVEILIAIVLGGLGLGWVLQRWSVRQMLPTLERLAVEIDGEVRFQGPFLMPKLVFAHAGRQVEVSSASSGTAGDSTRYTYALFEGLAPGRFEFRIVPRSLQSLASQWTGLARPLTQGMGDLAERLVVYTNDEERMATVLSERVRADLSSWAGAQTENRISDVRNYDDKLIYAVTGTLSGYDELRSLIDSSCRFLDAVDRVVPGTSGAPDPTWSGG